MKTCPYCAEEDLQDAAIVCKHCGHGLIDTNTGTNVASEKIIALTKGNKDLLDTIAEYQKLGWLLVTSTPNSAQMTRKVGSPGTFWWIMFIAFVIAGFITGITFLFAIAMAVIQWTKKPEMIILTIGEDGQILTNGNVAGFSPATIGAPKTFADSMTSFSSPKKVSDPTSASAQVLAVPLTEEQKAQNAKNTKIVLYIVGALAVVWCFLCQILPVVTRIINGQ